MAEKCHTLGISARMARPVWSGSISFGLVNVPVKAYSAVRDHDVHFHQLDKRTGARVRIKRVSEDDGKEVESDDIELGYEIRKDHYVTFDPAEIADLRPTSTRSVEVTDFVDLDDIDPIYYERTYWLGAADESAHKAYALLLAAMEQRNRAAIGTVVMRNKQYLAAIRPLDGALAMSMMRFADEIVPRADVDVPKASKADARSLKVATQLIDALSADWQPEQYHDTFAEELRRIMKAKDAGKKVRPEKASAASANVVDLMEALQASVDAAKSRRGAKPVPSRNKTRAKKLASG